MRDCSDDASARQDSTYLREVDLCGPRFHFNDEPDTVSVESVGSAVTTWEVLVLQMPTSVRNDAPPVLRVAFGRAADSHDGTLFEPTLDFPLSKVHGGQVRQGEFLSFCRTGDQRAYATIHIFIDDPDQRVYGSGEATLPQIRSC